MLAQEETKTSTTVTTTVESEVDEKSTRSDDFPVFYIGFRFMPTFTSFDYNEVDNSTVKAQAVVGYGWGGFFGFNFTNHFAIQAEVLYSPLVQEFKEADRVNRVKIDYINIPLLLRFNTGYSKPVNFNVVFGPQLGINVGSSIDTENSGPTQTVEAKLAVKTGDLGVAYGAGLDFSLGGHAKLGIGFRGVYGLVDISDDSNTQTTEEYYVIDKTNVKSYAGYVGLSFGF